MSFETNHWQALLEFTQARIAIGRAGTSLPTHYLLNFRLEHAKARDAVYTNLDTTKIKGDLKIDLPCLELHSQATDRLDYLKNPTCGRKLEEQSVQILEQAMSSKSANIDKWDNENNDKKKEKVVFVVADGLSATAVNTHSAHLLNKVIPYLQEKRWHIAPICFVEQGRVASADEVAALLQATIAVMLIGERPGLSAADSLGIYITFQPAIGITDEKRNCISNVRPEGLDYEQATAKLIYLLEAIHAKQLSGVQLKDEQNFYIS
jgi:ethanolamine ammonia-lyase small subunit